MFLISPPVSRFLFTVRFCQGLLIVGSVALVMATGASAQEGKKKATSPEKLREIKTRLEKQLKDLKLERKLVRSELKRQLIQVAEYYSSPVTDSGLTTKPELDADESGAEQSEKSEERKSPPVKAKVKLGEVESREVELAYLEVLKLDLEDKKAREFFRDKGSLDEIIDRLKKQGFPKIAFPTDMHDRKLGLPPQESIDKHRDFKLVMPTAPGAPKKKSPNKTEESDPRKKEQAENSGTGEKSDEGKSKKLAHEYENEKELGDSERLPKKTKSSISVEKVLRHHQRQFRMIDAQEKNVKTRISKIKERLDGK